MRKFRQSQNALAYSPNNYVLAYYQQSTDSFSLVDLDSQDCIYTSKLVFDLK